MTRKSERLLNATIKDDKHLMLTIGGKFYFSPTQRMLMDNEGVDRNFCQLKSNPPEVWEYTELIDWELLLEEPLVQPIFSDAVFVGVGYFHSHIKIA